MSAATLETFAEAWVAAVAAGQQPPPPPLQEASTLQANATNHYYHHYHPTDSSSLEDGELARSPTYRQLGSKLSSTSSSSSSAKSLPVHCTVEHFQGNGVELDSYAIIPSSVLFTDLVKTALLKLGYSAMEAMGAKATLQIRNWKALTMDQISDVPHMTVGDILGDISLAVTLVIQLFSGEAAIPDNLEDWTDSTVRSAVLLLLREISQSKLAALCPLSQPLLSTLINNKYHGKLSREKCREFGQWYQQYRLEHPPGIAGPPVDRPPQDGRLTFHPTCEVPSLRQWYNSNPHPSSQALLAYANILNHSSMRQHERPKVTIQALKNWWKNERQRERRLCKLPNGLPGRRGRKPRLDKHQVMVDISS